jgi:hypothetical protein
VNERSLPWRLKDRWSSQLERGLSVEAKLRAIVGRDDASSHPRSRVGWINPDLITCGKNFLERRSSQVVAVYGNSFAKRLGEAIERVAPDLVVCQVTAPLATQSWTFAAWQDTRDRIDADVEIFTVTSGRVPYTTSMSPMLHLVDPYAYFNPRYVLDSGRLARIDPIIRTLEDLRRALYSDPSLWRAQRQQLADHDPFFESFVFDESVLDWLVMTRVARRLWGKIIRYRALHRVLESSGFRVDSEEIRLVKAMIAEFARGSRARRSKPIVYLVSIQGHGVRLQRAVQDALCSESVASVSSHDICPSDDPSCFSGEYGHFTRAKDVEIARVVLRLAGLATFSRPGESPEPADTGRGSA